MAKTNLFEPKGKFKKDNYFRSRSFFTTRKNIFHNIIEFFKKQGEKI